MQILIFILAQITENLTQVSVVNPGIFGTGFGQKSWEAYGLDEGEGTGCEIGGGGAHPVVLAVLASHRLALPTPTLGTWAIYLFPLGLRESSIKVVITFTLKSHYEN